MPDNEVTQTFQGKVGNVYNADTIIQNSSEGNVPGNAVLAATLINRGQQVNPIVRRLEEMQESGGVLLVVVPSLHTDYPDAFTDRCGLVEFVVRFGGIGAWQYLQHRTWPDGGGTVEEILRDLGSGLSFSKSYNKEDIEKNIAGLRQNLCFAHFVDENDWGEDGGELAKNWGHYLVSGNMQAGERCFIVAFLCFVLGQDDSPTKRDIQRYIDNELTALSGPGGRVLVTKPLDLIRKKHALQWRTTVREFLDDSVIGTELISVADRLFPDPSQQRRLQEIWDDLCDAVKAAAKCRPAQFAETRR